MSTQRVIKINKMGAVGLFIVVLINHASATMPEWPLRAETEHEMYVVGKYPKVGEVFEVVYRVRLKSGVSPEFGKRNFYVKFGTGSYEPAEVVGTDEVCIPFILPGEWQEVRGKYRIPKPYKMVIFNAWLGGSKGHKYRFAGGHMRLFLIDSLTGQYGTKEEYEGKLPVEYRYDPLVGTFTCSPSQNPAPVEENRNIIKTIKQLAPTLSDSLALVLHSEQYWVGIPKGLPKWDSLNQRWKEEEIFEYYLKHGWLDALHRNEIEKWREKIKAKIKAEYKEEKSQFFRGDSDSIGADDFGRLVSKTFYGQWRYKNHYYNKEQGLLGDAKRDTVKHCRARCLIRYTEGSTVYYSYFNQKCITDDNGYFRITINVNPSWRDCRVYPVLFPLVLI